MRMPMLFVDLDNTISDRASSFRRWAHTYLTDRFGRADEQLISAMVVADGDGLRHKPEVAADLARLLDLTPAEQAEIIVVLTPESEMFSASQTALPSFVGYARGLRLSSPRLVSVDSGMYDERIPVASKRLSW